ncbi:hypothetical protein I7I51_07560 [Histoplasma capsulatum]|uniref:Uncharacterized protein n=1 Tax=Ajellomyces capsulatus TaxID=5037 RepID=A0A8A1M1R3_AJECA|nr:predicted protein [Histoplasma mississippiense (nom. inval.)]EDN02567.1 predicted protein [Histoplasma mississippiense (nom. inval.)]QSS58137.1 hypothetical protein I7I51_07560 [Histoplasma capsulatum]
MTSSSTPVKHSDTAEMLLISPIIVTPNGQPVSTPSPNRKRKITPSSEESSAKESLSLLVPLGSRGRILFSGQASRILLDGQHLPLKLVLDWEPLFISIKTYFQEQGISITEVMCFYIYDDEIGRPASLPACRLTDPTPNNPDNNEYSTLQPGLRVTSDYLPSTPGTFLSTTAGVLVRDAVGNEFMTVASHGFPDECGLIVNHPLPSGRDIGDRQTSTGYLRFGTIWGRTCQAPSQNGYVEVLSGMGMGTSLVFFKYAPKAGVMKDWCAGIAADELIHKGYTLVDTTDRQELLKQE